MYMAYNQMSMTGTKFSMNVGDDQVHLNIWTFQLESARMSKNEQESARINMSVIKIRLPMKKEQTEWLMEVFDFQFGMMVILVILVMVLVMIINHHQN